VVDQFQYGQKVDLMMDSGVFTYRKKNIDISLDKYINFLNANVDYISSAVTMDYPHDPKEIIKNTEYIRERLDPKIELVPVIQSFIFNQEQIEYFLHNYNYICVGTFDGIHQSIMYTEEVDRSLDIIRQLNETYKKKLHLLGRTKASWLVKNNWLHTTDSSAFARYIFTGQTVIWDPIKKALMNTKKEERFLIMRHAKYYENRFGITEEELHRCVAKKEVLIAEDYPHNAICALSYILMQEELRKTNPNLCMRLASSNASNFGAVNLATNLYFNRNKQYDSPKLHHH
jgi:hypothetical protein